MQSVDHLGFISSVTYAVCGWAVGLTTGWDRTEKSAALFGSTKKSVIQLGLLLRQIDSFLEVGVVDDVFQEGSNLCIKHLKIWESMPYN